MKSTYKLFLALFIFGSDILNVQADTTMSENELSKYLGVTSCIDSTFFDGGYEIGDKNREALMTDFLTTHNLPNYNEEIYSKASSTKLDTKSYTEGSMMCINDVDALTKIAAKYNIVSEEY